MVRVDTFTVAGIGSASDSRLQGITRALAKTYTLPREDVLPERLAVLIARLKSGDTPSGDRK